MVQLYHGNILHSKSFLTTPHTPKFELKRRSYGSDKLDKENYVATEKTVATEKLRRNRKNRVATKTPEKTKKKAEKRYFGLFSSPFHPRPINTHFLGF